jgi:hypothetical protein
VAQFAFGGSLEPGGQFCVGKNLASATVKMLSHLINTLKEFYKYRTFSAIFKDSAAIHFIKVRQNEVHYL